MCGHGSLAEELDGLLQAESEVPQLFHTTLLSNWVIVYLFRHTTFLSSPVIPGFFLIHERKFQSCHEELMREIAKLVPSLVNGKKNIPLVTDEEVGTYQGKIMAILSMSFFETLL